jgi:hypothetical protein
VERADVPRGDFIRVLTASERPDVHTTISRALQLLGEQDAAALKMFRADTAATTLSVASAEHPKIAFLDVTIGEDAGVGLVHFLQATVPGVLVVAIVPEDVKKGADVRLAEQAASLGAAYVLLGELTGDDVLRAFMKVAPSYAPPQTLESISMKPAAPVSRPPEIKLADVRTFADLEGNLDSLGATPIAADLAAAVQRCIAHERSERAPMQDTDTSAYSFAYFVDLAGREIDLARRHGRRFALATVEVVPSAAARIDARGAVELVLGAVRDTDVVARADENELLLLLPETGTKGARTLRRRILERSQQQGRAGPLGTSLPLRVGLASFPFDGEDLSRLLRIARRRADRWSPLDGQAALGSALADAVAWLGEAPHEPSVTREKTGTLARFVALDVPMREAWALLDVMVRESTRGGDAIIGLHAPHGANEAPLGLAQAIRASTAEAFGPLSGGSTPSSRSGGSGASSHDKAFVAVMSGASRLAESATFSGLEVVGILSEHACYGLVGRVIDGHLLALQTHDLPLVEALVNGLDQPVLRRGALHSPSSSAAAASSSNPSSSLRGSRSDPHALRGP